MPCWKRGSENGHAKQGRSTVKLAGKYFAATARQQCRICLVVGLSAERQSCFGTGEINLNPETVDAQTYWSLILILCPTDREASRYYRIRWICHQLFRPASSASYWNYVKWACFPSREKRSMGNYTLHAWLLLRYSTVLPSQTLKRNRITIMLDGKKEHTIHFAKHLRNRWKKCLADCRKRNQYVLNRNNQLR